jgi:hypothetical protein
VYVLYFSGSAASVDSCLRLVDSRHVEYQTSGIKRLSQWHTSEDSLAHIVAGGGVEKVAAALQSVDTNTRMLALELLVSLQPVGDARRRLQAEASVLTPEACCADLSGSAQGERCLVFVAALGGSGGGA